MMYSCNFFSIYSLHLFSRTVWEGTLVTKLSGYHNYFGYHHLSGYHHYFGYHHLSGYHHYFGYHHLSGYHHYFGYHHLSGYHHHSDGNRADGHPNYITHFDIVISNDY